uniref:Fibronectin type-III domain-containing protein n=2 Tax=Amphimedon queenslandica TaxID=400682 RepID=A0A1X7SV27_AMPQE
MVGSLNMMAFVTAVMILCQICFSVSAIGSIFFIIVPVTQYVYANDTVTFECATNTTQFGLFFVTNPSVAGSIYTSGGMASLTLTATSEVNGTEVTCIVHNGATTEPAYLYVQGPPDSVSSLTRYQLDSCCMFISWYPPFTLPGLTVQYIISVGTDQQYLNDSITNYTYCPMNPTNKQYLFNVTTTNKAGNGSTSNITVGFQSSKLCIPDYNYNLENTYNNYLKYLF